MSSNTNPIVIVTGANTGVGFGICQRLLIQCASLSPQDASLRLDDRSTVPTSDEIVQPSPTPVRGLTLILACRNASRAQAARKKLLRTLDNYLEGHDASEEDDEHAEAFRQALRIDFVKCDLSTSTGVFEFCEAVERSYSYVTHIVCNAGIMDFSHMVPWLIVKQLFTDFFGLVSFPIYKVQHVGRTNDEGLGWTFQCNLFGHYCLVRRLQHVLLRAPVQARVMWTSSLDAYPRCLDINDWQSIKSDRSYEGTKYATDLIVTHLNTRPEPDGTPRPPRNILIHPGFTLTDMITAHLWLSTVAHIAGVALMFIARWLGSVDHAIVPLKGAISGSFAILAPSTSLPDPTEPVKLGSKTTRGGRAYVGVDPVQDWPARQQDAEKLVHNCENLYGSLLEKRQLNARNRGTNGHAH